MKYQIENDVRCLKSVWKKEVKKKIHGKVEHEVREKCKDIKKTSAIQDDELKMKEYLKKCSLKEASGIMKIRLHMTKIPCNYGLDMEKCPLCGLQEKIETEHYFGKCLMTNRIADIWGVKVNDINGSVEEQRTAMNYMEKVEVLMEQYMT